MMIEFILSGAIGICVWYLGKYLIDLASTYYKPTTCSRRRPIPRKQLSELDKLLIKPDGVESPVHEICVAILENLDTKRFRFSVGESKAVYSQVASYYNTPTLAYDTIKNVSISFTDSCYLGSGERIMRDLSVNGVVLTLSTEEAEYVDKVWSYAKQRLRSKKDKLAKLKEQRHRRAITKLYSEEK